MNIITEPSVNEERIVQEEFEKFDFHNYEITDKLRDVTKESTGELFDYCGHSFALPEGEEESVKISFHVYMDANLNVIEVYAYECDSGQAIEQRGADMPNEPAL